MSSVLERQLNLHQEVEFLEQNVVNELLNRSKPHKERLVQEHCVNLYLNEIQIRLKQLMAYYEDENGVLKNEINAIAGPNQLSEFYSELRAIRGRHIKNPNAKVGTIKELMNLAGKKERVDDMIKTIFSGDECYGKYFDLNEIHELYLNLSPEIKCNMLKFLNSMDQFHMIPISLKKDPKYSTYLVKFVGYLESFFERQSPLFDYNALKKKICAQFEKDWSEKNVIGWFKEDSENIFCEACDRLFYNPNVYKHHVVSETHKKAQRTHDSYNKEENFAKRVKIQKSLKFKDLSLLETLIKVYLEYFASVRENTILHTERKQTLTTDELLADVEEEAEFEESEEEDEKLYNPLKLPLGWDGKPIPYWLYKLNGLGVEYPCEICGNYVYMGRKAFDRHFQEWRHAHGMRCLGIPNTRHFQEITLIKDAYALWEKYDKTIKKEINVNETMEEFEDAEGNIFNKKTYDDLKRQGLI